MQRCHQEQVFLVTLAKFSHVMPDRINEGDPVRQDMAVFSFFKHGKILNRKCSDGQNSQTAKKFPHYSGFSSGMMI